MVKHLTKEYFQWLFFKVFTNALIILSVFFCINVDNTNIPLGIALFVLSMITSFLQNRIKPIPVFARCTEDSGMYLRIYTSIAMTAGLGLILLIVFFGSEELNFSSYATVGIFGGIFLSGLVLYMYSCTKCGVLK